KVRRLFSFSQNTTFGYSSYRRKSTTYATDEKNRHVRGSWSTARLIALLPTTSLRLRRRNQEN
ncbi:MAG: hypothetical protein WD294_06625, partial [Phycisphaeraceae bacterium]